jgi:GNAT superfamily N-acetyltransferase
MDVTLRRATPADADAVADLYLRARHAAADIPPLVHNDGEIRDWIVGRVIPQTEPWIAENDVAALVGLAVLDADWLDQLYVEPTLTGRGVGAQLLSIAKRERPSGLRLWTFASNIRAQRFYEGHGFVEFERTDGDNEERAPDILYVWRGSEQRG